MMKTFLFSIRCVVKCQNRTLICYKTVYANMPKLRTYYDPLMKIHMRPSFIRNVILYHISFSKYVSSFKSCFPRFLHGPSRYLLLEAAVQLRVIFRANKIKWCPSSFCWPFQRGCCFADLILLCVGFCSCEVSWHCWSLISGRQCYVIMALAGYFHAYFLCTNMSKCLQYKTASKLTKQIWWS